MLKQMILCNATHTTKSLSAVGCCCSTKKSGAGPVRQQMYRRKMESDVMDETVSNDETVSKDRRCL